MSTDARVTKDLIETLEDGKDGFARAANHLADSGHTELATEFHRFSAQRAVFSHELEQLAAKYGDDIDESGSFAASMHRAWMTLVDAFTGTDADGVLDVALQGEDHAISEFEKALEEDVSAELRIVVERQLHSIREARNTVQALRQAA